LSPRKDIKLLQYDKIRLMKSIQKKIFRQHWKVVYTFCFLQDSECDGGTMKEGKTKINEELVITRIQYRVGRTWEKRQTLCNQLKLHGYVGPFYDFNLFFDIFCCWGSRSRLRLDTQAD
jgi:hypothetical protein